jgi:hypothetical protein
MTNKYIIDYLDYYVSTENVNFAVLLKGKWGAGKTYFIKNQILKWAEEDNNSEDHVSFKPIYISLNGVNTKKEIIEKLKEKLNPFLYSKGMKVTKAIFKGFIKSTLKIDIDYDKDGNNDGRANINFDPISIFKEENENIKGDKILIFDDIERCKIPLDELYGFINDFVEHSSCKVILLSDEKKIIENEEKAPTKYLYSSFKEKIIGQTFEISPSTDEAVDYFIEKLSADIIPYLKSHRDLIIKIFNTSEKENLRVLQRALFDFNRLTSLLPTDLASDKDKYPLLIKSLLSYFLIYYLEFHTGNDKVELFQQIVFKDEDENKFQHYVEAIKNEDLIHSTRIFTPDNLLNFISSGIYEELIKEIENSIIYKPAEEKDWEKLWYWKFLDDDDFEYLLPSVSDNFFKTERFHFTEVLHIAGILFNLIDNNLYSEKTKIEILDRAKLLIAQSKELKDITDFYLILRGTWRKSYASEQTDEFKELVSFLKNTTKAKQSENSQKYVSEILFKLTSENIDNLYEEFKNYDYANDNIFESTPIFKGVDPIKFADVILGLTNKAIFDLTGYIEYRYYPERRFSNKFIEDYHIQELPFISGLRDILLVKQNNLKPLKLTRIKNLIEVLSNIEKKLQEYSG